jgi:hypothetical protein
MIKEYLSECLLGSMHLLCDTELKVSGNVHGKSERIGNADTSTYGDLSNLKNA